MLCHHSFTAEVDPGFSKIGRGVKIILSSDGCISGIKATCTLLRIVGSIGPDVNYAINFVSPFFSCLFFSPSVLCCMGAEEKGRGHSP